jgi:hypothetical protein
MLVVTVEIWPGGDANGRRDQGQMQIANESGLADVSHYAVAIYQEASDRLDVGGYDQRLAVTGHARSDGPWKLVHRALSQVFRKAD